MTKWRVGARLGLGFGIALMIVIVAVDIGLVWLALSRPVRVGTFVIGLSVMFSLGLVSLLGYWMHGLAHSVYLLDRNALTIQWGSMEQVIPIGEIERVVMGNEVEGSIRFSGGMWHGHCLGFGEVPDVGFALFYGTVPPRRQIYVVTPGLAYGVSPADPTGFLKALRRRLEIGPTQVVEQSSKRPAFLSWSICRDRLGLALLELGVLAFLALMALLSYQFLGLPRLVPMHFDALGNVDRYGPRDRIFVVPLIGLLALLLNTSLGILAYQRERMASYLLWGGTVLVQLLVWMAAAGILKQL